MAKRKGQYRECPHCGANLDPEEICDCRIVDDCNYCAHKENKDGRCYVCSVKGNGKNNMFDNYLLYPKNGTHSRTVWGDYND